MQYETPEDALKAAVAALGGPKKVGVLLWPQLEEQPDKAGRKLADHLNEERSEKLALEQVVFIFRRAKQVGFHEGMYAWNQLCGYSPSKPLNDAEEIEALQRAAFEAAMRAQEASQELFARMKAAGLNLEV